MLCVALLLCPFTQVARNVYNMNKNTYLSILKCIKELSVYCIVYSLCKFGHKNYVCSRMLKEYKH